VTDNQEASMLERRLLAATLIAALAAAGRLAPADEAEDYFPPPESQGGWRKLEEPSLAAV
jgi:CubicO group peptidase (beta-lactamase class C family)